MAAPDPRRLERLRRELSEGLTAFAAVEIVDAAEGRLVATMPVGPHLIAPNGYLHAAALVLLADTACGIGCWLGLPEDGPGFTTVELKCNFVGAAREGTLRCEATRAHGGRSTEVWDALVTTVDGRAVALFRCTQMILAPRGSGTARG